MNHASCQLALKDSLFIVNMMSLFPINGLDNTGIRNFFVTPTLQIETLLGKGVRAKPV